MDNQPTLHTRGMQNLAGRLGGRGVRFSRVGRSNGCGYEYSGSTDYCEFVFHDLSSS
jgi:hypothetical protein